MRNSHADLSRRAPRAQSPRHLEAPMNEKTRTSRIRQELERAKAELARQDHEVATLSADIDPADLAEAEATFAKILRQSSREEETPKQALVIPTYALRV